MIRRLFDMADKIICHFCYLKTFHYVDVSQEGEFIYECSVCGGISNTQEVTILEWLVD